MSFDSYKWIKSFKRSRAANRVSEAKLPDEGFSDPDQMREDQDTLKALYKKRADAARKGQTGLLNSLHKQIEKLTKKMKIESVDEDSNIFSADDEQSWPSGPFGKKDDYADEAGSSYKRAKDWQIDKPGDNEDSKATGYKKVKN